MGTHAYVRADGDYASTFYFVKWIEEDGSSDYYQARILLLGARGTRGGGHWTWDPNIQQCLECYSERLQKNGVPAHMLNVAVKQLNRFVVEKLGDIEKLAKRQEQKEARGDGAEEM
ncbi:hypothetical protein V5799_032075 [Amblyomma americanum]|uniref:Uncharacterized protein n=1 Tax=Amblyomma americanum TaxID=6943 RepID=A0AAQ4DS75_AMBAM